MVRTDFVRCTMAVFVIFHENKIISEACKNSLFRWLLKWGALYRIYEKKKISDWPLLFLFLDAYHLRGILGSFYENENILSQWKSLCVCMIWRAGTAAIKPRASITAPRKTPRWRNTNGSCTRTPVFRPLFQTLFSNVQSPYPIVEASDWWGKSKTNDTENSACPRRNIRGKWRIG